jgi:hypothetical protein
MNALALIALAIALDIFALSPIPRPLPPPSWLGKLAFIGVFVVLLVWLVLAPDRLIGNVDGRPPWWRNARVWAILVCVTQIIVYLHWG